MHGLDQIIEMNNRRTEKSLPFDVQITNQGSIFLVKPLTDAGVKWLNTNVKTDEQTQFWCGALVVEHRFIASIKEGMAAAGIRMVGD